METVVITTRKGGTGKTATTHALGAGLMRRGFKVLFIDLDSQTNLSTGLRASTEGITSMDVLTHRATAAQAIQRTEQGDVIAASEDLASADIIITGTGKEYRLREALAGLQYDYIVIDTPAALGTLTVNALTAADRAIVPAQADIDSLQAITQLSDTIGAVKKYCNRDLRVDGILLTRYSARAILSRDMLHNLEEVAEQMNTRLYSTQIRENVSVREAKAYRTDIFTYSPRSNAAKDYNSFIDEFLG